MKKTIMLTAALLTLALLNSGCKPNPEPQKGIEIKMVIDYNKEQGDIFSLSSNNKTLVINKIEEIPALCEQLSAGKRPVSITITSLVMMTHETETQIKQILQENNITIKSFNIPDSMGDTEQIPDHGTKFLEIDSASDEANDKEQQTEFERIFVTTRISIFGGGRNIIIENGEVVVQVVNRKDDKFYEVRYKRKLTDEYEKLFDDIVSHPDFPKISGTRDAGVPDETLKEIIVLFKDGKEVKVRKWKNEKRKEFDEVFDVFVNFTRLKGTDKIVYTGLYNPIIKKNK